MLEKTNAKEEKKKKLIRLKFVAERRFACIKYVNVHDLNHSRNDEANMKMEEKPICKSKEPWNSLYGCIRWSHKQLYWSNLVARS